METKGTTRKSTRKSATTTRRRAQRQANLAVGYLRVSTEEQVRSGAGLDAQRTAIETFAAQRGLEVIAWHVDEGVSGAKAPMTRPALAAALDELATGPASVLLFGKADRVGRRAADLLAMRARAEREGWTLASADAQVDLTTAAGRMMFTMLAGVAEMERELIQARTREGLAAKRAAGVRLGRPSGLPAEVVARIVAEREAGRGWSAIATGLNADAVPTAQGGARWYPATVQKVWKGQDAVKARAEVDGALFAA
jgi:DNA invertase Pin-like site-specific DNA recombinase